MALADHRCSYLAALNMAHAELDEILPRYNRLVKRKEQLEKATEVLETLFESEDLIESDTRSTNETQRAASPLSESRIEPEAEPQAEIFKPVPRTIAPIPEAPPALEEPSPEEPSDPIQRRILAALKLVSVVMDLSFICE